MLFFSDGSPVRFSKNEEFKLSQCVEGFEQFLRDKEGSYIFLEGSMVDSGEYISKSVPIVYSCDEVYKKRTLARLYKLENWYQQLPPHRRYVSMMTLTTYQRTFKSYFDQYRFIAESWQKLKDVMRLEIGHFEYVLIAEPHKNGFLHFHILIFQNIRPDKQEYFKRIWSEKYQAGSYDNGLKVDVSNKGCLRSAKNYLMKYIQKTLILHNDPQETYLDSSDLVRFENPKNDEFFLIFQAIKWFMNKHNNDYTGIRSFQPSRNLSHVMSLDYEPSKEVNWERVTFVCGNTVHVLRGSQTGGGCNLPRPPPPRRKPIPVDTSIPELL
jgi:hypothetical protein